MYQSIQIHKGKSGWGGPLVIAPTAEKHIILSVTGGGIAPLAEEIARLTGGIAIDAFEKSVAETEIACVVINCGGTARCGVYPKKGILTINTTAVGQSGPLAKFMLETNYVSDVSEECISLYEESAVPVAEEVAVSHKEKVQILKEEYRTKRAENVQNQDGIAKWIALFGRGIGVVVGHCYQAARESLTMLMQNILPFMIFVAMIVGIITASGLGDRIAVTIAPMVGSLMGMVVIAFVCSIPLLSPILGPGAVIAQVVGTLVGTFIADGAIPVAMALPALFAIDAQVGCDFIPVGLSLGEAEEETVEVGVPAIMFSRLITGPLAVLVAYVFSIGMYS